MNMRDQIHETGGPAFSNDKSNGMALRDWFAGQALAGMLASTRTGDQTIPFSTFAKAAYEAADGMIVERKKPRTNVGRTFRTEDASLADLQGSAGRE